MLPKDYHNDKELNVCLRGNSALFDIGPDYRANECDAQLPVISTIGRGPKGEGLEAELNEDGALIIKSAVTGEVEVQTDPLVAPRIEVRVPNHNPDDGEVLHATVHVAYPDGGMEDYDLPVPAGAHGSRFFLSDEELDWRSDETYTLKHTQLKHYNLFEYSDKPMPRQGDIVVCKTRSGANVRLCFGTVESVLSDGTVVFTSRTHIAYDLPYIGKNGNWYVENEDTGVQAQGPKGDQGEKGDPGKDGKSIKGDKGDKGAQGERGEQGLQGEKGEDGLPANIEIGEVTLLPSGSQPSVTTTHYIKDNRDVLNFGIPAGTPGKAVTINGGIYTIDTLPNYDDTEVNQAFIVKDDDRQFDLYVRGEEPVIASEGGPWTVVEDWQGRPGTGMRVLLEGEIVDESLQIAKADAPTLLSPYDLVAEGDLVIDTVGNLGAITSAEDANGYYVVTKIAELDFVTSGEMEEFVFMTFSSISDHIIWQVNDLLEREREERRDSDKDLSSSISDLGVEITTGLASKADLSQLPTKVSDLENDSDFVTQTELDTAIEDIDVDLTGYATEAWVTEKIAEVSTGGEIDLSAYETKADHDKEVADLEAKIAAQQAAIDALNAAVEALTSEDINSIIV